MLTFNQLQEKKTKIKINPKVQDQYEGKKSDGIELVDEGEKVARGAQKRAEQLGAKRRQASYKKYGANVGSPGKNERAAYNLASSARSRDASLETQVTKKKKPAGADTSQIGHMKKRDEKTSVGKRGGKLKTPKYKLSMSQRVDHHSNKALNRRDPKQNPKHTANEAYTVNQADKTSNTPAYQGYKAGKKNKLTGEPLYKKGNMKENLVTISNINVKPSFYNDEKNAIKDILKKNFNLGEEGYDIARDRGMVRPSKDKKDGTSYPPSAEMRKTQKVNKGPSALERVKKKYKGQIMNVDKKKKEKK